MVKTIKILLGISLICCMLLGLALTSLNMTEMRPTATNVAPQQMDNGLKVSGLHAPIIIDGNADFASQASSESWPGNGMPGTPYVISDYVIITSPSNPAVYIYDTTVYFIIENVTVRDSTLGEGFKILNVTNGEFRNNIAINCSTGFSFLSSSSNNILSGNTAINNSGTGFSFYNSPNNNLINNTAKNIYGSGANGFYFFYSPNNNLINNTARDCDTTGFKLDRSSNNILSNNTAATNGEGFYILGSDNTLMGNTANANSLRGFKLQSCSLNLLIDNTATNNANGIVLDNASQNVLIYNTVINNGEGISLQSASQNILIYNTATGNAHGLSLMYSNYSTIASNTLSPNDLGCIWETGCIGNTFDGNICEGPGIPGFNLAILIGMIAVISAVFLLRKYQCGRLNLY